MRGVEGFFNFNKQGGSRKKSVNIGNEQKKRHRCLILMLNLKVTKQTRRKAGKNKVVFKGVSNISVN